MQREPFTNLLTIDVEDYFQVHAFAGVVRPDQWNGFESRVERNTHRILEILDRTGTKATFFVLGWVADKVPGLVKTLVRLGHEVASHGYGHQHIAGQSPKEFREDVRRSKDVLEDVTGRPVYGYRAPTYSVSNKTLWALPILAEEGFLYDSSIFPIRHDYYGIPSAPRQPFRIGVANGGTSRFDDLEIEPLLFQENDRIALRSGELLEIPVATFRLLGMNIPVVGGGYFRILPYWIVKWGLKRINEEGGIFVFYLHPWEVDPDQPRVTGVPYRSRFRHYTNLDKTQRRLEKLVQDFSFVPIGSRISFQ